MNQKWDAGDMGCGQLVFELNLRMKELESGDLIEVTASSPGAPKDLPAWCRMCGHELVLQEPPTYVIKRK